LNKSTNYTMIKRVSKVDAKHKITISIDSINMLNNRLKNSNIICHRVCVCVCVYIYIYIKHKNLSGLFKTPDFCVNTRWIW